jgi:hypothetical protein
MYFLCDVSVRVKTIQLEDLEVKLREDKLHNHKTRLQLQQNVFTAAAAKSDESSFDTSHIIANESESYSVGEYMKEYTVKTAERLCSRKQQVSFKLPILL